ncbi:MAG TPA: 1-deoxy-D-xylulose-5-phosphate synthase [Coriobacteriaceae bacterium]|nr:1-deoxy-D-xylulose-5-phosphate synthase [Coriobacteriaceae bacterium]
MTEKILDTIESPADLADLSYEQLNRLAFELRAEMIAATSLHGGHLAPSLGSVELIIALHRVLDCPRDRLVFDVGHQAYAHKLLTGRRKQFKTLRTYEGISGFPKITESAYDAHDSGHASDSLSTALGYALARDLDGSDATIAALIGDASFTGGMALEALNDIGRANTPLLIVLNDNGMSISPNVGGFSTYLAKVRMSDQYTQLRNHVEDAFNASGTLGRLLMRGGNAAKESFKQFVLPGATFLEGFGVTYIGPVDGHDIQTLEEILRDAKALEGPVVIHAVTMKGKGYGPAEKNPALFHGVAPFDIASGTPKPKSNANPTWTQVFSDELIKLAEDDPSIVAITAAMASGTGLSAFAKAYPERFFDVGIAEEHAVGMASSLALAGKKPVVAIYSTFMQRAIDQAIVNVGLQKAHVVFCLDRAGLVGDDGPTHHGVFDLVYLRMIPNMRILAPSSDEELRMALRCAMALEGPVAIRYPRGSAPVAPGVCEPWQEGHAAKVRDGADGALLALGRMVDVACEVAEVAAHQGVELSIWDMRWAKPIDADALRDAAHTGHIFTLEDGVITGGFGSGVLELLSDMGESCPVRRFGIPDTFVTQGPVDKLFEVLGLDAESISAEVLAAYQS